VPDEAGQGRLQVAKISARQGRAGHTKNSQGRVGYRLPKSQQGRLQIVKIPQPAGLYL